MRALSLLLPLIAGLATMGTAPPAFEAAVGEPIDHLVLISIDGLRPEFYLDTSWPAPMIQQMAREGVRAEGARGVYPSVTYPTHATIITGALPKRHGIHYNSPFEPDGETGRWYWEAAAIRVPTLWDAVHAAGLSAANLSWPVSVGAPVDWNLPEIWSVAEGQTAIDALRKASAPDGLWEEIEREATGRLTMDNFDIDWITRDDRAGDIAAYLLTTHRPALMTVHLLGVDHFQHEDGRDSPRVRRALSAVDSAISQIVEAAERVGLLEDTAFIITGDHGFFDVETRLAPNVWLVEAGLMTGDRDRGDWQSGLPHDGGVGLPPPGGPWRRGHAGARGRATGLAARRGATALRDPRPSRPRRARRRPRGGARSRPGSWGRRHILDATSRRTAP